jgi:uncharacterized protein YecE (DUF72 family)
MKWHIGCSGFHYKEWKNLFYPEKLAQKKWFEFYSAHFDTLELNVTFYRFPRLSDLQNWYAQSPPRFIFSVKAPRLITHFKKFNDCKRLLDDFYRTTRNGLKEKLGLVLFQLPPRWDYKPERLKLLTSNMESGIRNAVEFRDKSWWNETVYRELKNAGIIFTGISHPQLPPDLVINNKTVYYRFHGTPRLYYSVYKNRTLEKKVHLIEENPDVQEIFIYFNNTATTGAIKNAAWLKTYLNNKLTLF